MTIDKERAETWRKIADCYESLGEYSIAAADARIRADALDPPKPEYPDGMHAIVTFKQRFDERSLAHYACRSQGVWAHPDGFMVCDDADVTKVEPLRVLADDEIALPRIKSDFSVNWRTLAVEAHRRNAGMVALLCDAYADALDAEAGEQS